MVVTIGAIMFIELWNKLKPISDTRKSEEDDSDTVNIVQLRIQHEIEKQVRVELYLIRNFNEHS